jgi:hypothetical protein
VAAGELVDPLLLREAGIRAGRCAKALNQWDKALSLYTNLQTWLPSLRATWENEIITVQRNLK